MLNNRALLRPVLTLAIGVSFVAATAASAEDTYRVWRTPGPAGYYSICGERRMGDGLDRYIADVTPGGISYHYSPTQAMWEGRQCVMDTSKPRPTLDEVMAEIEASAAAPPDCPTIAGNWARMSKAERREIAALNASLGQTGGPCGLRP